MPNQRVERLKGTNDLLGEDYLWARGARRALEACFESYGYQGIEVPLVEQTELFLRKAGGEVVAKTYSFADPGGQQVSLRPEFTASVVRAFLQRRPRPPLPARWHYGGPVFRYARGQEGRWRQFTQVGVEFIGCPSPQADAEVVELVCRGLETLGASRYNLVMGHVGLVKEYLDNLRLSGRMKDFLVANLPLLGRASRRRGSGLRSFALLQREQGQPSRGQIAKLLGTLGEQKSRALLALLLDNIAPEATGGRRREEVVERLLRKLTAAEEAKAFRQAVRFLRSLGAIKGEPRHALERARELAASVGVGKRSLAHLQELLEVLAWAGVPGERLVLDFGLARDLTYYTGMVFEIYLQDTEQRRIHLGGGGRYDGLVRALGGRSDLPALGFAYRLEPLLGADHAEGEDERAALPPLALVVPLEASGYRQASALAQRLRAGGWRAAVETRARPLGESIDYARRLGAREVYEVGPDAATCSVLDLERGEERVVALSPA